MEQEIVDAKDITQALRKITYGYYIASARYLDELSAGTVQWVTQASFNPPLLVVCIQERSHLNEVIEKSRAFALNMLGDDQRHLIAPFSKPIEVKGNKLNGLPYQEGLTSSPLLIDLPAFLECKVLESVKRGDHIIYIGEVVNARVRDDAAVPLVEWDTEFHYGG